MDVPDPKERDPFPGLRPFLEEEHDLFFGREKQIDAMLARLEDGRFLAVVGSSGSGKSSLVRAGLIPMLREGMLTGAGSDWEFVILRPGTDPFGALALALHECAAQHGQEAAEPAFTEATLRSGPRGFVEAARELGLLREGGACLLLVDQFEELFRFSRLSESAAMSASPAGISRERNDAAAFVSLLLATARQCAPPIQVILTMRSDFIGHCEAFRELPEAVSTSQFLVPRLVREQMRETIEGPLALCGARAQPELVNQILNDAGPEPDQLPLLQHALMRMWQKADGRKGAELTLEHYRLVGYLSGALSQHADEAWSELDAPRQTAARHLFLCLSKQTPAEPLTRRPTTIGEVAAVAGVEAATVVQVVNAFQQNRRNLIIAYPAADDSPAAHADGRWSARTVLDISHEALLRRWERLNRWLREEAESASLYLRLSDSARRYAAGEISTMSAREVLRATDWMSRRRPTEAWAARYNKDLTPTIAYIGKSRRLIAFRFYFIGLMVLLAAGTLWHEYRRANLQRDEAVRQRQQAEVASAAATRQRDENQALLAASLLRAIGQTRDAALSSQEVDALWDLASLPPEDKVRRLFFADALSSPRNAQQFANRMDFALQACIGLSPVKRAELAQFALSAVDDVPELTEVETVALRALCRSLAEDAPTRLAVARKVIAALPTEPELFADFLSLAPLLPVPILNEAANRLAERLVDGDLRAAGEFGGVASVLQADAGDSAAETIFAAIKRGQGNADVLFGALEHLGPQLTPPVAASVAEELLGLLDGDAADPALASLAALAPQAAQGDLSRIGAGLRNALGRAKDGPHEWDLLAVAALFGNHLPPEMVAQVTDRVSSLISRQGANDAGNESETILKGCQVLAAFRELSPEMSAALTKALRTLPDFGAETTRELSSFFRQISPSIAEPELFKFADELYAANRTRETPHRDNSLYRELPERAYDHLAEQLVGELEAIRDLVKKENEKQPSQLEVGRILDGLRRTRGKSRPLSDRASAAIVALMDNKHYHVLQLQFVETLLSLNPIPGEAANRAANPNLSAAAGVLYDQLTTTTSFFEQETLATLIKKLDPAFEARACQVLETGLEKAEFAGRPNGLPPPPGESGKDPNAADYRLGRLIQIAEFHGKIDEAKARAALDTWLNAKDPTRFDLDHGVANLARHLPKQTLVEYLKNPLCRGAFRSGILSALEGETLRQFHGDIWEFVQQAPGLGLDAVHPPVRPKAAEFPKPN